MARRAIADRPIPYDDIVTLDRIQDYVYKRTRYLAEPKEIRRWIRDRRIQTITRPRMYGGGTFTRKKWLNQFIEENS